MDSHPSNAEEAEENFQDKKSDAVSNFSPRGATPTVLTLFSEALNEKNFDENEEKIFEKHLEFLVGGPFDLELRNVRQNRVNVKLMLELTDLCPPKIQVWSTFVGIVKKNVQTWTEEDDQLYNVLIQTTQQIFDHPAILHLS
ncbi:unnamed protein product [Meloidogyne enterolobii]|uniref:Uncharacterized protein n=1 Tax=Meloidogyne enterolobii TaxID=390850 RepID=A0ACB1AMA5_MELEN